MINKTFKLLLTKKPSLRERFAIGKSLRKKVTRYSIGEFNPGSTRKSPIDILISQAKSRIPEYIPIRYARMAVDPFAFFRGGAAIMANDLAGMASPEIIVQLCGDMHISNFGFFSTSEHQLVLGINDFDETLPGNFDWDLKRLVASAMIASQILGKDKTYGEMIVRNITKTYRHYLEQYINTSFTELKHTYIDEKALKDVAIKNFRSGSQKYLEKLINKSRENNNHGLLGKITEATLAGTRLIENPPTIEHLTESAHGTDINIIMNQGMNTYFNSLLIDQRFLLAKYQLLDYARKVVGIGSVGTSCWILYFEGNNHNDPLFLQAKEAQKSVLAPFFPKIKFATEGERVVLGQSLIQGAPDLLLGYGKTSEKEFYVRQLRDMKGGISIGDNGISAQVLPDFAKLFGWALANAHARSGDAAILAGYCGKSEELDDALVKFSISYSKQNEEDYSTFLRAIKSGKIPCATNKN